MTKPFLRPAENAEDAVKRAELILRAAKQRVEIEQYFVDIAAWNYCHPFSFIDPDPDGTMASLLAYLRQFDGSDEAEVKQ